MPLILKIFAEFLLSRGDYKGGEIAVGPCTERISPPSFV